jgi:hypothetical protein
MENLVDIVKNNKFGLKQKLASAGLIDEVFNLTKFLNNNYKNISFSQRIWHIRNNNYSIVHCAVCNTNLAKYNEKKAKYVACSEKCTIENSKKILNQVKSNDNYQEKLKTKFIENYGVDNPSKSDLIKKKIVESHNEKFGKLAVHLEKSQQALKNKIKKDKDSIVKRHKENFIKKYGVDNPAKLEIFTNKAKKTNITLYGVDNPAKLPSIKDKIKKTVLEKYNSESYLLSLDYQNKKLSYFKSYFQEKIGNDYKIISYNNLECNILHLECNNTFTIHNKLLSERIIHKRVICNNCNKKSCSQEELQIEDFLKTLGIKFEKNNRNKIKPFEIDFFFSDKNIGIEYNRLFFHSSKFKDKNYHYQKYRLAKDNNIDLIQIPSNYFLQKREITENFIKVRLGITHNFIKIQARKCKINLVPVKEQREFLNNNHFLGYTQSTVTIGLYCDRNLVQLISFKRFNNYWELNRLCTKNNTLVIGGIRRLFKYFVKNYAPKNIITYNDVSLFKGDIYEKLGFNLVHLSRPNYCYTDGEIMISKQSLRKNEKELAKKNCLYKYYNCGIEKYSLSL